MSEAADQFECDRDPGQAIDLFRMQRASSLPLFVLAVLGLGTGLVCAWFGLGSWSVLALISATAVVLFALAVDVFLSFRKKEFGLDIIAALAMGAALWFGEYVAAAIVAVMFAGGQSLESYAQARAESGMTELLSRVPRLAVMVTDAGFADVAIEEVLAGDRLLVRNGDVVPVDGHVDTGHAILNEAALTGESLPVRHNPGQMIMSGASNIGDAFEMIAAHPAAASTYASIVRLIAQARSSKAPMSRLADRYALAFLAITLAIAILAALLSGEPTRAVAVLVVATPCPLILAVPVALVAGVSKASRNGILIKGASVLEVLASIRAVVFDKTGTLTTGQPTIRHIDTNADPNELLGLAASLDQASAHTIARAVVAEAKRRKLVLSIPATVTEVPGEGIEGYVGNHRVAIGGKHFIAARCGLMQPPEHAVGTAMAYVAIDGHYAGAFIFQDPIRTDALAVVESLRGLGIKRISLATGDRNVVGKAVGQALGLDFVRAELAPAQKVEAVKDELNHGHVMMIGDGVNDAPALAAASVGVAVGRGNLAAAAEAADVVLLRDNLQLVATSIEIARWSRRIALESVYAGIGLSVAAMIAAGCGYLSPIQGALLQEIIDVAVIFNALRAG
ncbi:heavy metal translocating P-type ATPase (plasmid) [Rhizobium sp. CB3090]|uniref:heavy metal translocating P-type ATPase n=1 Tax=Rhizobium sp. CB3090 TaxID=3039156 RepID=UPI0024B23E2F|nr:heavy metal translocating P-type ATPase [Rhizobium sp. CB3090]WFU13433.1 heavy metal translocating P-type ATPase [Rhizobium sp. CB3090]